MGKYWVVMRSDQLAEQNSRYDTRGEACQVAKSYHGASGHEYVVLEAVARTWLPAQPDVELEELR